MNLSTALSDSIRSNSIDTVSSLLEVGIDSFLDDGLAQSIPLLSTVRGIYKVGKSINDLHLLKKLDVFVCAMRNGAATEAEKEKYRAKICNSKQRDKELEYLLIIINRYVEEKKPEMLAKLYLAYLDEKVTWEELTVCAEITDRFIPGDYELLKTGQVFTVTDNQGTDNALRLIALGLAIKSNSTIALSSPINETLDLGQIQYTNANSADYQRTALGDKMVSIIENTTL